MSRVFSIMVLLRTALAVLGGSLLRMLLVIWLVLTVTFMGLKIMGGNPVSLMVEPRMSPQTRENLKARYGYDASSWQQYGALMTRAMRGDLGISFTHKQPVSQVLLRRIPRTLLLGAVALMLATAMAGLLILGHAAKRPLWMRSSRAVTSVVLSVPSFVLGAVFMAVVGVRWGWLPFHGVRPLFAEPNSVSNYAVSPGHLILPALALALPLAGQFAAYLQEWLRPLDRAPFVISARGRGVSKMRVLFNHKLRQLKAPAIQMLGLQLPMLACGALVIECMFGWDGMGLLMYDALLARDLPLLLGACVWTTAFVVLGYEMADRWREASR